ncbi:TonB-dependent receptor [Nitrospirillum viridazoti Y2]|uniref:TonB-dependent receptor n=2 Tax=Nitrospirillum TaxID=1543705 RepID=A0A560I2B9_9PROT|nr:TonB-dependent receptor [Nitrospirillum amazonense Y2]TWB53066.1 TonB-dependent receptor [Nitrospirillum amazonense]
MLRGRHSSRLMPLLVGLPLPLALIWSAPAIAQTAADGAPAQTPAATAGTASANDQGDLNEIIVTGVRASLKSAEAIKRDAPEIVDSIVAEDIGKLPDRNVAEALQRVAGIQIQRNYGEGSSVAIRGLTQVRTELNGRDIFTAGGVDILNLEDVPAELLAGIDVYKNPSAEQIEGQLSGVINFRTRKPFDFDGFKFAGGITGNYYDLADKTGPSGSVLMSDRWNTGIGEIGVLADIAYQKDYFRDDQITTEPFYTLNQNRNPDGSFVNPSDAATAAAMGRSGQLTTISHGGGLNKNYGNRQRFGTDVALQWKPTDTLDFTGEVLRNNYKFNIRGNAFFATTGDGPITPLPGADFKFAGNGDFISGTWEDVPLGSYASLTTRDSTTTDYSLKAHWTPTPNLEITADGQYIRSDTSQSNFIVITNGPNTVFHQNISGDVASFSTIPASQTTNTALYSNNGFLDDFSNSVGEEKSGRLDLKYSFDNSVLKSLRAGFRYTDRTNSTRDTGYRYSSVNGRGGLENYDLSDIFRGDANVFGSVVTFPLETIGNYANTLTAFGLNGAPPFLPSGSNAQSQQTYAEYAAAYFDASPLSIPLDGNIGVRVVTTNLGVSGYYQQVPQIAQPDGSTATGNPQYAAIAFQDTYTKALPSLNLRYHLTDALQLRLAASTNLAAPTFSQLNPSLTLTEPGPSQHAEIHTATGGNPLLKPMTSRNLDASLEWYFSDQEYVSVAGFYKKINGYIQTAITPRDITFPDGKTYTYQVTSYTNAADAEVKGAEFSFQQFFDFLPDPLDGLGIQANFTYVDSQAPSPATSGPVTSVPLELLSRYSYNLIGIYEKGPLSLRLAYNWRSKFVETTAGVGTGNLPIFDQPYGQLDGSLTYQVTHNFSLGVDARNINNALKLSYFGIATRPRTATISDRRLSFTARVTY